MTLTTTQTYMYTYVAFTFRILNFSLPLSLSLSHPPFSHQCGCPSRHHRLDEHSHVSSHVSLLLAASAQRGAPENGHAQTSGARVVEWNLQSEYRLADCGGLVGGRG